MQIPLTIALLIFTTPVKNLNLAKYIVKKGQSVKRGEIIGYVGSTGKSVAPHLHYEVHKNKKIEDPAKYFFTGYIK